MGIYFEKSAEHAVPHLEKAAQKGLVEAIYLLGVHYYDGDGVQKDTAKGMSFFEQAAEKGLASAQHNLACIYFQGDESDKEKGQVKRQVWKAAEYWKMAASQNFPLSLVNLGKLYYTGYTPDKTAHTLDIPIQKDLKLSKMYLERVVDIGGPVGDDVKEMLAKVESELQAESSNSSSCIIM
jgi:TPR repeat protein